MDRWDRWIVSHSLTERLKREECDGFLVYQCKRERKVASMDSLLCMRSEMDGWMDR
jgi:hypothetical protein